VTVLIYSAIYRPVPVSESSSNNYGVNEVTQIVRISMHVEVADTMKV